MMVRLKPGNQRMRQPKIWWSIVRPGISNFRLKSWVVAAEPGQMILRLSMRLLEGNRKRSNPLFLIK
jgi:hypothetical protein